MVTELKKHTLEYYDYHDMVAVVERKYGVDVRDFAGKYSAPGGTYDRPYQDLWHWLLDNNLSGFNRGAPTHLNWGEARDWAVEQEGPSSWQAEVLQLFVDEFGTGDWTVIIDW